MHFSCSRPDPRLNQSTEASISGRNLKRLSALGFKALIALVFTLAAITVNAQAPTDPKHFFWAPGQGPSPNSLSNDLIYHGGNAGSGAIGVENTPAVYLIFWGPDWAKGFTTADASGKQYTSQQLQNYEISFLTNLGGTPWAAIQTEYCRNVPAGTTNCGDVPGGVYVTNPRKQLKGVWTDATPVPSDIVALGLAENLVDDPLAVEAMRASAHFHYDPQATYIILTPPTTIGTGQPVYCGYHTQTDSVDGLGNPYRLQYSFIPFLNANWPGLGSGGCGMNSVNVVSDDFGHGVFDGYSIVVGHEYAEAITDPDNFATVQDGWNDAQGSEDGDKCAWTDLGNVPMNNHTSFAVQPLWSNKAFDASGQGCVRSAPTNPHAMPPVGITPPAIDICITLGICPPGVAAGQPMPVNMAYFGGKVQVNPKIYLVLWGWGQPNAFDHSTAGNPANDPDGVAGLMTRFVAAMGGTTWGNISSQYYQSNSNGTYSNVGNPKQQLAGVWWDNTNAIHDNLSPIDLAREAARAVGHFRATDLANSNFVIATPQKFNDAGFNQSNYCAWHDFTTPVSYPGVQQGIAFTNMPYILNAGGGCGKDFVNPAPSGDHDGVTIVLGHEIAETLTDPGAESTAGLVQYGAWFDYQSWEIGDKCAWVGDGLQVPGAPFNMIGNDGRAYPVQTLWSDKSLNGVGYCSQGF
jgi:serine protease